MTIQLREKNTSRTFQTGESAGTTLLYTLTGTDDDLVVEEYVAANTPPYYNGLVRQEIDAEPECVDEETASGRWNISVKYGLRSPPAVGEQSFSFDTTGGTQHITQSIRTVQTYGPAGDSAANCHGAIGVTHDSVEGVDIGVTVFNFSIRKRIPVDQWSADYMSPIYQLTWTVNNAPFSVTIRGKKLTFAAGECLFQGATGDESTSSDFVEITYKFAGSPNVTDQTIGDITGITKKGWHYMWVRYRDSKDPNKPELVKKPVGVYIEQVYPEKDFSPLGSF